MKRFLFIYIAGAFLIMTATTCKEVYNPPTGMAETNYLVVDGFLDNRYSTTVTLSRTRSLADTVPPIPEFNAQVSVEGSAGDVYPLSEAGSGNYMISALPLNTAEQYRLDISTADGKIYQSDFVDVKVTPPIDSISFAKLGDGVHVYANTHDATANSKYYQWEFIETWEYRAFFDSQLEFLNGSVQARPQAHSIYRCWHTAPSTSIFISSTSNLSADVVSNFQLVYIPTATEKLGYLYSIWVKQHVLTKEGFEFWQNLKKNTEELGSLFDAQPFQVTGNIHCVSNPTEPVIGFVSAGTSDSVRIFINEAQVEPWAYTQGLGCQKDVVTPDLYVQEFGDSLNIVPVDYYYVQGLVQGIYGTSASCADCRLKGGTTTIPSYWPR